MTLLRIEPVLDPHAQKYFLAIYSPHDADQPFVTTPPRYQSPEAAENDLIAIIAAAAGRPDPVDARGPLDQTARTATDWSRR